MRRTTSQPDSLSTTSSTSTSAATTTTTTTTTTTSVTTTRKSAQFLTSSPSPKLPGKHTLRIPSPSQHSAQAVDHTDLAGQLDMSNDLEHNVLHPVDNWSETPLSPPPRDVPNQPYNRPPPSAPPSTPPPPLPSTNIPHSRSHNSIIATIQRVPSPFASATVPHAGSNGTVSLKLWASLRRLWDAVLPSPITLQTPSVKCNHDTAGSDLPVCSTCAKPLEDSSSSPPPSFVAHLNSVSFTGDSASSSLHSNISETDASSDNVTTATAATTTTMTETTTMTASSAPPRTAASSVVQPAVFKTVTTTAAAAAAAVTTVNSARNHETTALTAFSVKPRSTSTNTSFVDSTSAIALLPFPSRSDTGASETYDANAPKISEQRKFAWTQTSAASKPAHSPMYVPANIPSSILSPFPSTPTTATTPTDKALSLELQIDEAINCEAQFQDYAPESSEGEQASTKTQKQPDRDCAPLSSVASSHDQKPQARIPPPAPPFPSPPLLSLFPDSTERPVSDLFEQDLSEADLSPAARPSDDDLTHLRAISSPLPPGPVEKTAFSRRNSAPSGAIRAKALRRRYAFLPPSPFMTPPPTPPKRRTTYDPSPLFPSPMYALPVPMTPMTKNASGYTGPAEERNQFQLPPLDESQIHINENHGGQTNGMHMYQDNPNRKLHRNNDLMSKSWTSSSGPSLQHTRPSQLAWEVAPPPISQQPSSSRASTPSNLGWNAFQSHPPQQPLQQPRIQTSWSAGPSRRHVLSRGHASFNSMAPGGRVSSPFNMHPQQHQFQYQYRNRLGGLAAGQNQYGTRIQPPMYGEEDDEEFDVDGVVEDGIIENFGDEYDSFCNDQVWKNQPAKLHERPSSSSMQFRRHHSQNKTEFSTANGVYPSNAPDGFHPQRQQTQQTQQTPQTPQQQFEDPQFELESQFQTQSQFLHFQHPPQPPNHYSQPQPQYQHDLFPVRVASAQMRPQSKAQPLDERSQVQMFSSSSAFYPQLEQKTTINMQMPSPSPSPIGPVIPPPNIRRASTLRPNTFSTYANTDMSGANSTPMRNKHARAASPPLVPPAPPLCRRAMYFGPSPLRGSLNEVPNASISTQQPQQGSEYVRISNIGRGRGSFETPPRANTHHSAFPFHGTSIKSPTETSPIAPFTPKRNVIDGSDRITQLQTLQHELRTQQQNQQQYQQRSHVYTPPSHGYGDELNLDQRRNVIVSQQRRMASTLRVSKVGSVPRNVRLPMQSHSASASPVPGAAPRQQHRFGVDASLFQ